MARTWWQDCIIYQIYPASFQDSNSDGIGDIVGIISRLDYIKSIGVNAIWICPIFDSPQVDMGYDVSDYQKIYAPFGNVQDVETLITESHARGMKMILDLVINHTSDQHTWFKESRSSKQNAKRDWYIWSPAKFIDGQRKPPNNWACHFGGSAWEWDEVTHEYYLHLFCREQPDLNWENPVTRKAIYESAIQFWLEKGIDGFRVDSVNMYSKGDLFRDAPIVDPTKEEQWAGPLYCNGARMGEFLKEINAILDKYDAVSIGECPNTPERSRVVEYVSAAQRQLNMVLQFDVVDLGRTPDFGAIKWSLPELKDSISATQAIIRGTDGWTTAFLENHDQPRSISRYASDSIEHRFASGKMLALLLSTLSGTMFMYQGQELGMINIPGDWDIAEYKDVASRNYYAAVEQNNPANQEALVEGKRALQRFARDNARTPMQWDSSPHGGFSDNQPWMRANDCSICNVQEQEGNEDSLLAFWKKAIAIRQMYSDIFVHGDFDLVDRENADTFCFEKRYESGSAFVALNFTHHRQALSIPDHGFLLLSTVVTPSPNELQAFEGRVYISSLDNKKNEWMHE